MAELAGCDTTITLGSLNFPANVTNLNIGINTETEDVSTIDTAPLNGLCIRKTASVAWGSVQVDGTAFFDDRNWISSSDHKFISGTAQSGTINFPGTLAIAFDDAYATKWDIKVEAAKKATVDFSLIFSVKDNMLTVGS